jgi:hypothetical protein
MEALIKASNYSKQIVKEGKKINAQKKKNNNLSLLS